MVAPGGCVLTLKDCCPGILASKEKGDCSGVRGMGEATAVP